MTAFTYRDGALCAEGLPLADIARSVGTPFYCYSTAMLEGAYGAFADAFSGLDIDIHYAMKANSNRAVVATLAGLGAGADVVSEGEMRLAMSAGAAGFVGSDVMESLVTQHDLTQADPRSNSVTETALEWGFSHLGRFSAEYRALFGELPSETLNQAPRTPQHRLQSRVVEPVQ